MGSNTKYECPDCGMKIEKRNLNKHYRKLHPDLDPYTRMKETKVEKPYRTVEEMPKPAIAGLIVASVVAIVLIAAALFGLSLFQNNDASKHDPRTIFFSADDGAIINGTFWPSSEEGAYTIYLVHDLGEDRSVWNSYGDELQDDGYNVLAIDLRGHGESTKNVKSADITYDWTTMEHADLLSIQKDIGAAYKWVHGTNSEGKENTDAGELGAMIGTGRGGLYALSQISRMSRERMMSAVILTPLLDVYSLDVEQIFEDYGDVRPVMLAASEGDSVSELAINTILDRKLADDETNGVGIFVPGTDRGIGLLKNNDLKIQIENILEDGWKANPN